MVKKLEKKRKIALIFVIIITIEIFYFSSLSEITDTKTKIPSLIPTTYHFTIFFLLSFFIFVAIKENKKIKPFSIIFILIISIIYAILDEIHQIFIPFRNASFNDILIDSLGIFTSTLIYMYMDKNSKNN